MGFQIRNCFDRLFTGQVIWCMCQNLYSL